MWATFNSFEIEMAYEQAMSASHSGDCDNDVQDLLKDPLIRKQLDAISDESLKGELSEYGAWDDEELLNRASNESRIIWIAAGNIVDNPS